MASHLLRSARGSGRPSLPSRFRSHQPACRGSMKGQAMQKRLPATSSASTTSPR